MESIRIKNLRSLKDTGEVPILPLTVLLGKNSSGKSTFIRAFPLFKQSIGRKGPMLWFGELTDLGDFRTALTKNAAPHEGITFSFAMTVRLNQRKRWNEESGFPYPSYLSHPEIIPIKCGLTLVGTKLGTNDISRIELEIFDHIIVIEMNNLDVKSVLLNGQNIKRSDSMIKGIVRGNLIPSFFYLKIRPGVDGNNYAQERPEFKYAELVSAISGAVRKNVTPRYKRSIVNSLELGNKSQMLDSMRQSSEKLFANSANNWDVNSEEFIRIVNRFIYLRLDEIIEAINNETRTFFGNFKYIAPLRAFADRYYRVRNSSIDEIDHDGSNMAIIFRGFTKSQRQEFNSWLSENFNFNVVIQNGDGHVSVGIQEIGSDVVNNLSDTGFGYSQILPIITQLWLLIKQTEKINTRGLNNSSKHFVVAIEQPELHLHPAMQAMFIDSIVNLIYLARGRGYNFKCIIETHSETIINRISQLTKNNHISNLDVAIYIFEKEASGHTKVVKGTFSENGIISNWPIGFFLPKPVSSRSRDVEINPILEVNDANIS